MALLRMMSFLPFSVGMAIGQLLGTLLGKINPRRLRIVEKNIEFCFPYLDDVQRKKIAKTHLQQVGSIIYETAMFHYWSEKRLLKRMEIVGLDNLLDACKEGRGVILLSAHFVSMEIAILGLAISLREHNCHSTIHPVYQVNKNPLLEHLITGIRSKRVGPCIDRDKIKLMIKTVKAGEFVWYAPDQAFHSKGAEQVNFFGRPAWSNTATSRLAKISRADVIPFFMLRTAEGKYQIRLLPVLTDFPGSSAADDVLRYHKLIEQTVLEYPDQYLWIHRRFKPPVNQPDPYQG